MIAVHETRRARWARRTIAIPLYVGLAIVAVGGLPIWVVVAAASDLVRRAPLVAVRCVLLFALYTACEIVGIVASAALWRPSPLDESALDRHHRLQRWWARTLFEGARRIFGLDVQVEGDDDVDRGPVIVLIRHASAADTLLPVVLLGGRGLRMRYVLKRELLWDPCLDLVGQRLPNVFVRRGAGQTTREAGRVAELGRTLGRRDGAMIYPEGTRFSEAKRVRSMAAIAAQADMRRLARVSSLRYVLPPRAAGVLALLDAAPNADVLVVAHTGFEAGASLTGLWNGELVGQRIRVRMWRIPRRDVPLGSETRVAWLDAEWARIDAWIAQQRDATAVSGPLAA